MPDRELPPLLSPAEWEVMKVLWESGPLAARDVFARLPKNRGWAYKTVKTLLSRLVAKQALAYDQIGNSYLYRAAVDREATTRQEVRSVFQRLISEASSRAPPANGCAAHEFTRLRR
jgi:BlaI family transcriptional regulator, penicillinase repressor